MQKHDWVRNRAFLLFICLLLLGGFFRFANLDGKVYWHDEAYTSLRVSGYTSAEVNQQIFNSEVRSVADLRKYQQLNSQKSLTDTVKSLAADDAQHPPLYYVLVRLWMQMFGNSVAVTRSFSALVSLLIFPAVYLLCQELFAAPLVGWMVIAVIAVSPFHVLYAQEAREYSLWTVAILVSSWALLRAMRLTKATATKTWRLYAFTLVFGLYTFPLTGFVGLGHGIYVIIAEGFRLTKTVVSYSLAFLTALLSFTPWLAFASTSWAKNGVAWTDEPIPLIILLKIWGLHIARAFILTSGDFGFDTPLTYLSLPILLVLVSYSIYFICKRAPKEVWLFVLTLTWTSSLALVLPDLIMGGQRSTPSRYLIPFYLGIQLSTAYLIAIYITSASWIKRRLAKITVLLILTVGIISCAVSSQAETAWNKVVSYNLPQIARLVNQASNPLLITNSFGINFGNTLALGHILSPQVSLQLVDAWTQPGVINVPVIPQGFSNVFFLNPSRQFQKKIEQRYNSQLKVIYSDYHLQLWQLAQ